MTIKNCRFRSLATEGGGAMDYGIGISLPDGSVLLGCCRGGEPPPENSEEEP